MPSAGKACCEFSATTGMCCCCCAAWSVAAMVRTTGDATGISGPVPADDEATPSARGMPPTGVLPPPVPAVPATIADKGVVTPTPRGPAFVRTVV